MEASADAFELFGNNGEPAFDFDSAFDGPQIKAEEKPRTANTKKLIDDIVDRATTHYVQKRQGKIGVLVEKTIKIVDGFMSTIWKLVYQALKMAIFKFAMEFCAMAIKALVETVAGLGFKPSTIDTQGIFYNIANNNSSPAQQTPMAPPRPSTYDNPFGSPTTFGMNTSSGW